MIRVTFELLPGGAEDRARSIGQMEIANIGTHLDGTADYAVVLKKTPPFEGALVKAWKRGKLTAVEGDAINQVTAGEDEEAIVAEVSGHHRTRRGIYDLCFRALRACGLEARNR